MPQQLTDMVDMAGEINRQAEIPIHEGCDPRVAGAIRKFANRLDKYSSRSRRYSIYTLLSETIDGAWRDYIASLPDEYEGKACCRTQILSLMAEQNGFSSFHSTFTFIARWARLSNAIASTENNGPTDHLLVASKSDLNAIHEKFEATVSSLRELASTAELKKPRRISAGRLNARRLKRYCELCGNPPELAAVISGVVWPQDNPNGKANLSSRYCSSHRPKHHDGSWNPAYRRARRNKEKFEGEVVRVEHHTSNVPSISAAKSKGLEDPFLWALMRAQDLHLFEGNRLRNIARLLVDSRINLRRKQMVMFLAEGFSQSDIARRLGISRQAVSKTVSSKSFMKVSMMYHAGVSPHHQSELPNLPLADGYNASTSASICDR
jgi:DNA-binding CsgD family transcriptional regulator